MFTYLEYKSYLKALIDGFDSDDSKEIKYHEYRRLNLQRMSRWEKKIVVGQELIDVLHGLNSNISIVSYTEGWCGDGAHSLPLMDKLVGEVEKIKSHVIKLRDQVGDEFDQYLTNGARSIPKIVFKDSDGRDLFQWGPRPFPAQKMVLENKKNPVLSGEELQLQLQKWYNQDRSITIQKELIHGFKSI